MTTNASYGRIAGRNVSRSKFVSDQQAMAMEYWSFNKARAYVRKLRFESATEYFIWAAGQNGHHPPRPGGVPSNPHQTYLNEWVSMSDWLGTGRVATFDRTWLPFEEARTFVRELGFTSGREWRQYASGKRAGFAPRPDNIPSNPNQVYRDQGWAGMKDWLGTGDPMTTGRSKMRQLADATSFARSLNLSSWVEWRAYVSGNRPELPPKPEDVPAVPHECYRSRGWVNYGHFLGSNTVAWHHANWLPFDKARAVVASIGLLNSAGWRKWAASGQRPINIPYNPEKTYRKEWKGMKYWLGRDSASAPSAVSSAEW